MDSYIDLTLMLKLNNINYKADKHIITLPELNLSFYLVLESHPNTIEEFESLRKQVFLKNKSFLIFIWWDLWQTKKIIILSKIKHLCDLSIKVHARKTVVKTVNKEDSIEFYNLNHLNQPLMGFKRFGLYLNNELIALASFAKKRKFRDDTYSSELLQFSTKNGIHINGGLSKLVKHFYRHHPVKTIMTYIDLDWTNGSKFNTVGFKSTGIKAPMYFSLIDGLGQRELSQQSTNIFNMGSIKSILTID